jgi:hypothetical protein
MVNGMKMGGSNTKKKKENIVFVSAGCDEMGDDDLAVGGVHFQTGGQNLITTSIGKRGQYTFHHFSVNFMQLNQMCILVPDRT